MENTMAAMDRLVKEQKVDNIGVSNFSISQLQRAMRVTEESVLTDQVGHHAYWQNNEIPRFCQANNVILTAYSLIVEGRLVGDEELATIGERHGKSAAQVAIRWLLKQENVVTTLGTTDPEQHGRVRLLAERTRDATDQ
jgi:diketogulonate reductase-like aldo/keto reductase